jgi:tRNA pseudouridine synthase 10
LSETPHQFPGSPQSFLFEGRYRKLVRGLPQTIFFCPECKGKGCDRCEGFGRLVRDSVQDLIARVAMPRFKARRNKFHGAGREDIDVLMLGSGRPFVFEMSKVKRENINLEELAVAINERSDGRIEVFDLKPCNRKRVAEIKQATAEKEYLARVEFTANAVDFAAVDSKLDELQSSGRWVLSQGTPTRVAHRRGKDIVRERWIELLSYEVDSDARLLHLRSQHGTYVKEAISSDEGRTKNSFTELLSEDCVCAQLDVLGVFFD